MPKIKPAKKAAPAAKHQIASSKRSSLPNAAQKVLNVAMAISKQKQVDEVSRSDIATVVATQCNITGKSTVANAFTELKKANLIVVANKTIEITALGMEKADTSEIHFTIPKNTQEYLDSMKEIYKLKDKACKLVDELVDGEPHAKADVAEAIGCKLNSTFANLLTGLKKCNVIKLMGTEIQLTDEMRKYE